MILRVFYYAVQYSLVGERDSLNQKFIKQSWPLILSGMSFVIYNNIDKIKAPFNLKE